MDGSKTVLMGAIPKRRLRRKFSAVPAGPVKVSEAGRHQPGGRIKVLKDLALALLQEAQALEQDEALAQIRALQEGQNLRIEHGINFFDEVRQFEINLIRLALQQAGGVQSRAARLLGLRATTLNNKIKLYNI